MEKKLIDGDIVVDVLRDYLLHKIPSPFDDPERRERDFEICSAVKDCIQIVEDAPAVEAVETAEVIAVLRSLINEYKQVNEYKPEIEGIRVTWTDSDNLTSK